MVPNLRSIALLSLMALTACDRNIGPIPAHEPEYKTLFFAGTVTADTLPNAKGVLFIAAAPADGGVPPLAARYDVKYWPVNFELSDINFMGEGLQIQGPHRLFARFDTDGDVGSRSSYDLEIRDSRDFAPGATGITLVLQPLGEAPPARLNIYGTVAAAEGLTVATAGKTLFIFARGTERPMPLAALRVAEPALPYTFVLNDAHILMRDMPMPDSLQIVARLDADGDPVTRSPLDLEFTGAAGPAVRDQALSLVLATTAAQPMTTATGERPQ